ncbi:hypothetical protein T492DRAFT_202045 [Pavlovales sp. CCMP2436]|nr:hypothetical protein T492DRAFT_202045 [Pavlovales sp. CCMP2436]
MTPLNPFPPLAHAQPLHARSRQSASWMRVKASTQLLPRPSVLESRRARVSPQAVIAMCARLGISLTEGKDSGCWLAWLAVEALIAPLPALWRERVPADADPFYVAAPPSGWGAGGAGKMGLLVRKASFAGRRVSYEHEVTGEVLLEHPLLPAFIEHAAHEQRRSGRSRKWEHLERFMQFASPDLKGVFTVDLLTGNVAEKVPDLELPLHRRRRLQRTSTQPMLTMRQLSAFEALTDSRLEKDSDNNSSNNSPARRRLIRHHRRAMVRSSSSNITNTSSAMVRTQHSQQQQQYQ